MNRHRLAMLLLTAPLVLVCTVTAAVGQESERPQPGQRALELTPEEKAFLDQVKELRQQLRITRLELALLEAKDAPEGQIAEKAEALYRLEGRLYALRAKNRETVAKLERHRMGQMRRHGPGTGGARGMGPGLRRGMGRRRGHCMAPSIEEGLGRRGQCLGPGAGRHRGQHMEPGLGRGMVRGVGCGRGRWMAPGMEEGLGPRGHGLGPGMGLGRGHGGGMRMGLGMMRRAGRGAQEHEVPLLEPEAESHTKEKVSD